MKEREEHWIWKELDSTAWKKHSTPMSVHRHRGEKRLRGESGVQGHRPRPWPRGLPSLRHIIPLRLRGVLLFPSLFFPYQSTLTLLPAWMLWELQGYDCIMSLNGKFVRLTLLFINFFRYCTHFPIVVCLTDNVLNSIGSAYVFNIYSYKKYSTPLKQVRDDRVFNVSIIVEKNARHIFMITIKFSGSTIPW